MKKFEEIAFNYEMEFGEKPPILTTLSIDNEDYLKMLEKSIESHEPITRNDLAKVFMTNEEVVY